MSTHPLTLEAANMFCGKRPTSSKQGLYLKLIDVKLPHFEEFYIDHRAGGAPVAVEIDVVYNKLICSFTILGMDSYVYEIQRSWSSDMNFFYFYGLLRDRLGGKPIKVEAAIKGRLAKVEGSQWKRGDLYTTQCEIRGIIGYEFSMGGRQIYNWNFDINELTIGTRSGSPQAVESSVS